MTPITTTTTDAAPKSLDENRWDQRRRAAAPILLRAATATVVLAVGAVGYVGAKALQGDGRFGPRWPLVSSLRQTDDGTALDSVRAPVLTDTASPVAAAPADRLRNGLEAQKQTFAFTARSAIPPGSADGSLYPIRSAESSPAFRPADVAKDDENANAAVPAAPELARASSEIQSSPVTDAAAGAVTDAPMMAARNVSVVPVPPMPSPPAPTSPVPAPTVPLPSATQPQATRVIRNGVMEFEVDRFDTAVATLTKIVGQAGGFVATTNSDTLPNGKVKGLIVLRVPPDRLDSLVQSLCALGDLKSQQISADDVTKLYTDLQAELSADHAMQDRLLELIKSGSGQIKDLLAVEKELAIWKGKIEKAEGQIRYYDNLVAMSTLAITMTERDLQAPAAVLETETADLGIETDDVEHHYADALTAVRAAHGRIVESELKRYDAGQLAGRIVADVPPDAAGAVIDRLEQLGRVARMQVHVQQTDANPTDGSTVSTNANLATPTAKQQPTRLLVSLYNLANVAPRRTTTLTVAAADVEASAAALLQSAGDWGGRVVSSAVNRDDPGHITAAISLEIAPQKLADATAAIGARGDVLKLAVTQNADTANTTDAKQGIMLTLVSLASVSARENVQQGLAAVAVPAAYHRILDAATAAGATIRTAQLDESDPQNITGTLEFDLLRTRSAAVNAALADAGETISRSSTRSEATDNTVDSKIGLHLTLTPADLLAPQESSTLALQVSDPAAAAAFAQSIARAAGGQVLAATASKDAAGQTTAKVSLNLPSDRSAEVLTQLRSAGAVLASDASHDPAAPAGPLARSHVELTYTTGGRLLAGNSGLLATVRNGLATSIAGLLWSVQMLVVGLCLVGPWAAVIWMGWKLWRRMTHPPLAAG